MIICFETGLNHFPDAGKMVGCAFSAPLRRLYRFSDASKIVGNIFSEKEKEACHSRLMRIRVIGVPWVILA